MTNFTETTQALVEQFLKATFAPSHRLTGRSLDDRDPDVIRQLMPIWKWFYHSYFRVQTDGWHHIPQEGKVLLVGSHNGGFAVPDMMMAIYDWYRYFGMERLAYGLMDPRVWQAFPGVAQLATQAGAIQARPSTAIAALQRNATVLVYPGGGRDAFRPYALRNQVCFFGHKGFIKLALMQEAPIVPMISYGAHNALIVLEDFYPQAKWLHAQGMPWILDIDPGIFPVYLGLPWGLAIGPLPNFPLPVQFHTRICPPITFDRYGEAAAHDRAYVEGCYQKVRQTMQKALDALVQENCG
ncbi:MAG: glycerol acyltransferase [Leptolyngbyaceae cyanobacterium bins.59]|nr:glycerol acyltransferase [Leptolyngbyaceae cyanobacterium bins.59]